MAYKLHKALYALSFLSPAAAQAALQLDGHGEDIPRAFALLLSGIISPDSKIMTEISRCLPSPQSADLSRVPLDLPLLCRSEAGRAALRIAAMMLSGETVSSDFIREACTDAKDAVLQAILRLDDGEALRLVGDFPVLVDRCLALAQQTAPPVPEYHGIANVMACLCRADYYIQRARTSSRISSAARQLGLALQYIKEAENEPL